MDDLPKASIISYLYNDYTKSAKKRDIQWALSKSEFIEIISRPCVYCGKEPASRKFSTWGGHGSTPKISIEKINGIDRVDNTQGYHLLNCAPCCTTCNKMKLSMSVEDLLAHMKRILDWMNR